MTEYLFHRGGETRDYRILRLMIPSDVISNT